MQVDIGLTGQTVESGWNSITSSDNSTPPAANFASDFAASGSDVTVEFLANRFRDRTDVTIANGDMLEDFGFIYGTMTLRLGNLAAGSYVFTGYHHDTNFPGQFIQNGSVNGAVTADASGAQGIQSTAALRLRLHQQAAITFTSGWLDTDRDRLHPGRRINAAVLSGFELQEQLLPAPEGTGTIVNDDTAPIADAGGAYVINEGDGLSLNASASSDADDGFAGLTFRWDVDGDGDNDENVTGATPTLTAAQLAALGLTTMHQRP